MDQETENLIKEQIKTLPPNLVKAIGYTKWQQALSEIETTIGLNPNQRDSLEQETLFVLYGFESPQDYINNIVREAGIDSELAEEIADSVATQIFQPIDKKIRELESKPEPVPEQVVETPNLPEIAPEIHPAPQQAVYGTSPILTPKQEVELPSPNTPTIEIPEKKPEPPPITTEPPVKTATHSYPAGQDPYREPLD